MGEPNEGTSEAERLFEIVSARYGRHLNEDQLESVRKNVGDTIELVSQLRGIKLDNSIEPFSAFRPHRAELADG